MAAQTLANVSKKDISDALAKLNNEIKYLERKALKGLLAGMIGKIVLDPKSPDCQIRYRIPVEKPWLKMASLDQKTSNQLLDTLATWNEYLEQYVPFFKARYYEIDKP